MTAYSFIPDGVHPLVFLAMGSLSILLVSTAKAGFGGAIGLLATPIMIYACSGREDAAKLATAVMLPVLIAIDQVALLSWWRRWDWRVVSLLLPGAVAGIALGGAAFAGLNRLERSGAQAQANAALTLAIGAIALAFVAIQAVRSFRRRPMPFRPVLWQGSAFGLVAGFTSTLAHGAGPVTAMYLLPQHLPKEKYVASTVMYYWINNLLKVPVYLLMGRFSADSAGASVLLLPAAVGGTLLGVFLNRRVGQKHFNLIVYALLALAGVHLVRNALETFLGGAG